MNRGWWAGAALLVSCLLLVAWVPHGSAAPAEVVWLTTLPTGLKPVSSAVDPVQQRLLVTHAGDSSLGVFDLETLQPLGSLPLPSASTNVVVSAARNQAYVNSSSDELWRSTGDLHTIDLGLLQVVRSQNYGLRLGAAEGPRGMAISPDGQSLTTVRTIEQCGVFPRTNQSCAIHQAAQIDLETGSVGTVSFDPALRQPQTIDPEAFGLAVSEQTRDHRVVLIFRTPGRFEFSTVRFDLWPYEERFGFAFGREGRCAAYDDATGAIYAGGRHWLYVVARETRAEPDAGRRPLPIDRGVRSPYYQSQQFAGQCDMAQDRLRQYLYVVFGQADLMVVVDLTTGELAWQGLVGPEPWGVTVDETRNHVFVTNRLDNSLSVFRGLEREVR